MVYYCSHQLTKKNDRQGCKFDEFAVFTNMTETAFLHTIYQTGFSVVFHQCQVERKSEDLILFVIYNFMLYPETLENKKQNKSSVDIYLLVPTYLAM